MLNCVGLFCPFPIFCRLPLAKMAKISPTFSGGLMKTSLRLLCGVLLTAFALSGCAEQILDSASKDPAPTVTSGEESTANTIAKFSTSEGLAPQPSDVVLANVNAALPPESQLKGISRLMPIRIPFSGPLASLYNDNGSWNSTVGDQLKENLLIISTDNFFGSLGGLVNFDDQRISPIPTHDSHSSFPDGQFKVVYQDKNRDLVLVPNSSTFEDNTTYIVAVKTNLGDAQGNPLSPDILTNILTSPDPIIVDGKIVNTLVRGLVGDESDGGLASATVYDGLRAGYSQLTQGLQALGQIATHNDVAQLFTFTTEAEDLDAANDIALAFAAVEANLTNTASAYSDNITWATTYPSSSDTLVDQPLDLKTDVVESLDSNLPSDNVSTLYKGYFSCQNYLAESQAGWEIDFENRAVTFGTDCPNSDSALNGKIGFWIAKPSIVEGIAIYVHGVGGVGSANNKERFFNVINTMAEKNLATIAIDIWGHGERAYEDMNGNGSLADDSGAGFVRPDNPSLSVGYLIQTQLDLLRLRILIAANPEILGVLGIDPLNPKPTYYIGMSLGGIVGSNLANSDFPVERFVLNTPGGDIIDLLLNGYYGDGIRETVATVAGIDTNTQEGIATLNSTMLGLELGTAHALFKGGVDPLAGATSDKPNEVLIQQILNDDTIPNSNTELLALAMALPTYSDGEDSIPDNLTRSRWILNPASEEYVPTVGNTDPPEHGFLIDWKTEATLRGQQQAACFLVTGKVLDPSKEINITTCTNTN